MKIKDDLLLITLDGPSGSGKSTASIRVASHFRIPCLDTGAMYRTTALSASKQGINFDDEDSLVRLAGQLKFRFSFEGKNPIAEYSFQGKPFQRLGKEIRTPEVSLGASRIAKLPRLRKVLVEQQREIGLEHGGVIEGRDAGTVIFPEAPFKFFMTASVEERAKRRYHELQEKLGDEAQAYPDVLQEMIERDRQDEQRAASPLKPAADAIVLDTSGLDFEEVIRFLVQRIESRRL